MNILYPDSPTADPIERLHAMQAYLAQLEEQVGWFCPSYFMTRVREIEEAIRRCSSRISCFTTRGRAYDMLSTMPHDKMLVLHPMLGPVIMDLPAGDLLDVVQKAAGGRFEMIEPAEELAYNAGARLRIYVEAEGFIKERGWNPRLTPFLAHPRPLYGPAVLVWEKEVK
jgi:hypothetical protein